MAEVVLDASAVLAFVYSESGADVAGRAMVGGLVSAVNQAEVLSKLVDEGMAPHEAAHLTARLGYHVVPVDEATAVTMSTFQHRTRRKSVSLGDQFCLALGLELGLPVLTGEKRWAELGLDVEVILIR